jgi:hypothetical protein
MNKLKIIALYCIAISLIFFIVKNVSFESLIWTRSKISSERAKKIAQNYIKNLEQYKRYGGKDLVEIFEPISECSNCQKVGYEFILETKRLADLDYRGRVIVNIKGNKVVSSQYEVLKEEGNQITDFDECIANHYQELNGDCVGCPKKCKMPDGQIFLQDSQDKIYLLMSEIEKSTGIDFSQEEDVSFNWNYYDGIMMQKEKAKGLGFHAQNVTKSANIIKKNLKDNGFNENLDNSRAGDFDSLDGLIKNQTVCLIQENIIQQGEISQTQNLPRNIKVNCALLKEAVNDENNSTTSSQ